MAGLRDEIIVLDGGMGVALGARGVPVPESLWSAWALIHAPGAVVATHRAFIDAGARVITTNTYSAKPSRLRLQGIADQFETLTRRGAALARRAAAGHGNIRVAGCLPPLADSYRPDLVGAPEILFSVYRDICRWLADDVDIFLCETLSTVAEARAAARAAAGFGKPVWVSWSLSDRGDATLRSGESVTDAVAALDGLPVAAMLLNCSAPEAIEAALPVLRRATPVTIGGYPNTFPPIPPDYRIEEHGYLPRRDDLEPEAFARRVAGWAGLGACILGGCCGIGPDHIAALTRSLGRLALGRLSTNAGA